MLNFGITIHTREALVEALEAEGDFAVIKAEQVKNGGMQVAHFDRVLRDVITELVRRSMGQPTFDAATGAPDGEGILVMVATAGISIGHVCDLVVYYKVGEGL